MNKSRRICGMYLLFLLLLPHQASAEQGYVMRVLDGDTLIVKTGRKIEHIRIIGIDTPELLDQKTGVAQCYSVEAMKELKKLLFRKTVSIERDAITKNRDLYGRKLRTVSIGLSDIAEHLVKNGFARVYTRSPARALDKLLKLQNGARRSNKGLWAACKK